ncbi:zeta toxin family protein [Streptomyces hundungensis]|uniref:zeta toxin family protein n=1 Tax=Streptomyces hundungensis TaxID=1077946 RepID=UPI0033F0E341
MSGGEEGLTGAAGKTALGSVELSDHARQRVLMRRILPVATRDAIRQERPVVLFVAGPPGSGKTGVADLLHAVLDGRGGAVRVASDMYKVEHPAYAEALAEDVRTAGVLVRADTRGWQAGVEEHVREHGFDAVVETALADVEQFRADAAAYRRSGHRIEVAVLATAPAESQLGVLDRYLAGSLRYVSWENQARCTRQIPAALEAIEREQLADRVVLLRRGCELLYDNELDSGGGWRRRPAAARAWARETGRPWSAQETVVFRRGLARAGRQVESAPLEDDQRLAVRRDVERAAALAEPVQRRAQARTRAPGVDYHRLSADEHDFIFDEMLAPTYLSNVVGREDPQAVYVIGQPGAGKLATSRMVKRAMRPGTTRLEGDDFKAAHPDYYQLLRDDPRGAGAAIRADYRAWFTRAERHVRERRGDVLIEAAPGSAAEFLGSVLPFAAEGYAIEVVLLAVREADSRQATALRYARALQLGLTGRFTSKKGHAQCFGALSDIARLAQTHPAITATTVMRRGGHALLRHEAGGAAPVAWALAAEQLRPYTGTEAAAFLQLNAALRKALPQHREELEEIASMARPLMPARMQPVPVGRARPSRWPLPVPMADYDAASEPFSRRALSRAA